ncbi:MAG: class I SAM-dependent DNA methyltransferase [Gemmobacter sp.]
MAGHDGHLGAVYGAASPDQIAASYDAWAETYEAEMRAAGYRHPSIVLALLSRHLPAGAGPVLDAGAGTGLIGEWLPIMGYPEAEALDLSEGMLAVAASKGVYARLHRVALGGPLPFADGHFAGIVSAGVFTTGHVGAEALPELFRVARAGGVIVLTVKMPLWEDSIGPALAQAAGSVATLELTAPYVSMPGEAGTVPSRAVALRVLR